jgi:hypothetical protein
MLFDEGVFFKPLKIWPRGTRITGPNFEKRHTHGRPKMKRGSKGSPK